MKFAIRRNDGLFVQCMVRATDGHSYTRDITKAKIFGSREQAQRDLCPGNERVVDLEQMLQVTE